MGRPRDSTSVAVKPVQELVGNYCFLEVEDYEFCLNMPLAAAYA